MVPLEVYYAHEHEDDPIVVTTEAEVDALIDRVKAESPSDAPILMQIHPADGSKQEFAVGIRGDVGVLYFTGREWPHGVYSVGEGAYTHDELAYFFADQWTGFPSNAEIPLDDIRRAFKEHLVTDGARPTNIRWQDNTTAPS
ncbi:Imm1 family immunity protein [Actinokineospora iranica]|uniref:Immunity protein Imm1 n=1 Tax=Actinokineospora iranica TaxID=1271860 RepID=A0A1G6M6R4_9PSEU|nr:Immunity protein Imm1 [Actinokineospora iranica]